MNTVIEKVITEGKELHIRTGELLPQVKIKFPAINGTITAPRFYAEKMQDTINKTHAEKQSSVIIASVPEGFITLKVECDNPDAAIIIGNIQQSPESIKIGINDGVYVSTYEMSQRLKMNRALFENIAAANELIAKLQKFEADVTKKIADQKENTGSMKLLQEQAVTTNLPAAFNILISVYKGDKRQKIEVEIYINPTDLKCTLVSPEFQELFDKNAEAIIAKEIASLQELLPTVPVMYQ
jgi:hypothetical protein